MLMTLRSWRPTTGLMPTAAAVSIILLAGKQNTCSTPSRRNTSATAWLAFMPRSLRRTLNSLLHSFWRKGSPWRGAGRRGARDGAPRGTPFALPVDAGSAGPAAVAVRPAPVSPASALGGRRQARGRALETARAVRVAKLHQLVQVELAQGGDDRPVLGVDALLRLGLPPPPGGAVDVRHLPEPAHFLADLAERRQVEDPEVEIAVVPQHLGDVPVVNRDHHLVVQVFELVEDGRFRTPHRAQQLVFEQF